MKKIAVIFLLSFLYSCSNETQTNSDNRWYTTEQLNAGRQVYEKNCQVCHGANGIGDPRWKPEQTGGTPLAPPLDETAHAWHHSFQDTLDVINKGSGPMPGFQQTLSADEKESVIAYIHSLWPDETYKTWEESTSTSGSGNHEGH